MSILEFDAPREHLEWDSSPDGYIPPEEWTSKDHKFVGTTKDHRKVIRMMSDWNAWCPGGLLLESVSLELLLGPHGHEICKAALSNYGFAIKHIPAKVWESFTPHQADTLCHVAARKNAHVVNDFTEAAWKAMTPKGSYAICQKAIAAYCVHFLKHLPSATWESFTPEQVEELYRSATLQLAATRGDFGVPELLSESAWKAMSPEGRYAICQEAVSAKATSLKHLRVAARVMTEEQYLDLCKMALKKAHCTSLEFAEGLSEGFYESLLAIIKPRY